MKERIKAVRKAAGLNQTDFGKALGASLSAASKWESGENAMGETTILLLCEKFGINETWLRTGAGDMKPDKSREQEMADLVASLMSDRPESFRTALVTTLLRFDAGGPEWVALERIYDKISAEMKKSPGE